MFLSSHYFSNTLQDFIINYIHYPTDYLTIMKNPLPEIDLTKPELIKENNFFPQDNYLKHLGIYYSYYFYIYFIFSLILFVKFFEIRKFKKLINKELILLIILIFSLEWLCKLQPDKL